MNMEAPEGTRKRGRLSMQPQDLAEKNAVVTGASRGIGRAIALNLASRGASIIGTCSSQASIHHIDTLASEIVDIYRDSTLEVPKIIGLPADILSFDTPTLIADAVETHFGGKLHILVNNAAYDELRPMGQLNDEYVRKVLTGNTHSLVMTMEVLFRKGFIQPNSRIVNVSSVSGRKLPYPSMYLVGATKATMEALTRSWAELLGNHPNTLGTTANALLVGATATGALLREAPPALKESAQKVLETDVPILGTKGIGRPEDVADVAGLLVSEKARWITGGVVCANGGSYSVI